MSRRLTALIQPEGNGFVALCPELDIASQGDSIEAARDNLTRLFVVLAAVTEEMSLAAMSIRCCCCI